MNNVVPQHFNISRQDREKLAGHSSLVLWFTGLSGSGKSTIANRLEKRLYEAGIHTFSLDGDNVRLGLNKGLGFNREDRMENLRRIAEVTKLFLHSGTVVLASFISPLKEDRKLVKSIIGEKDFLEIFVNTPVAVCEARDVKGLYKKARAGEIRNFTGIDAPYEAPEAPFVEVETEKEDVAEATERIFSLIQKKLELKQNE